MVRILSTLILLVLLTGSQGFSQNGIKTVNDPTRGFLVKVGEPAPKVKMRLTSGERLKLNKLKGKVVMLQFTASWCKVCVKEMPYIEREIWQEHKDDDFVVIGVDRDEPLEDVIAFAERTGVTYPMALDPEAKIFQEFAELKSGVTRNVIIDKTGTVRMVTRLFKRAEFNEMKEMIDQLLEE